MKFPKSRYLSGLICVPPLFVAAVAFSSPAQADTFQPGSSNTTVTFTTAPLTGGSSIQPAANGSGGPYTISATIADANTLLDVASVDLCLYNNAVGDPNCGALNLDPQDTVKITWVPTNTFALLPVSHWSNQSSTSTYNPLSTSMTINFKFNVSEVALMGAWTAKITATAVLPGSGGSASQAANVNYFSQITAQRASQAFGTVESGESATALDKTDGTIIANGSSDISLAQAAFSDGTTTAGIADGSPGTAPDPTEVALDCKAGATYSDSGAIRLSTTPAALATDVLQTGTTELGSTANHNSCQLTNGGELPSSSSYSALVTVGVGAH